MIMFNWDSFLVEKKKKRNNFLLGIATGIFLTIIFYDFFNYFL